MEQLLSLIGIVIIVTIIVFFAGYLKGKYDYEKTEAFGGVMDVCKKCGKIKS